MRRSRFISLILVVIATSVWSVGSGLADDMPPPWVTNPDLLRSEMRVDPVIAWLRIYCVMVFCLCFTVFVEYLVVLCLLGWRGVSKSRLFGWMLFVNLITNPVAQCTLIYLGDPQLWGSPKAYWIAIALIEPTVVFLEFSILRRIFDRMYRQGSLGNPVAPRRVFIISVAANGASFSLGLAADYVFLLPEYIIQFLQKGIGQV